MAGPNGPAIDIYALNVQGADAVPCDDGDACTELDTCDNGGCVGSPSICDDGDACTADSCDPGTGCVSELIDSDGDGTGDCVDECPNDPNATLAAECAGGVPAGCDCPNGLLTPPEIDGTPCIIDLSMCDESEKANSWKGETQLAGTLTCLGYLNKTGMGCITDFGQGWPLETEPSWWCGEVVGSMCNDPTTAPVDNCPNDPDKMEPGLCGCGTPDTDSDGDLVADCEETCDLDPDKTEPLQCGCGEPETDSDGDLVADCVDECPNDPNATLAAECAGGVPAGCDCPNGLLTPPEIDGTPCIIDLSMCDESEKANSWKGETQLAGTLTCLGYLNKTGMGCYTDFGQGWPLETEPSWWCGEVIGSMCNDPTTAPVDNCPNDPDKMEPGLCGCGTPDTDSDGDLVADCEETCDLDPDKTEPLQCGCGEPETDSDGDLVADCVDACPNDPNATLAAECAGESQQDATARTGISLPRISRDNRARST